MKVNNLRLDKSCKENWDKMSPNNNGRFCKICSKTVIDFTKLTRDEIQQKLKEANGNLCVKVTKTQLSSPILLNSEKSKEFKLPYSKVAASVMLVASLNSIQACKEYSEEQKIELTTVNPSNSSNNLHSKEDSRPIKKNTTTFQGKVFSKDKLPLQNTKITFFTLNKIYIAFTDHHGLFKLEIPNDILDNKNVIRLSFDEIILSKRDENKNIGLIEYYENDDLILSKQEMSKDFVFYAEPDDLYLGGIGLYAYEEENNPLVIMDGVEVPFKEFQNSRFGKKSTCNIEDKEYYHFDSDAAKALCGDKAKYGLYLFYSKDL